MDEIAGRLFPSPFPLDLKEGILYFILWIKEKYFHV